MSAVVVKTSVTKDVIEDVVGRMPETGFYVYSPDLREIRLEPTVDVPEEGTRESALACLDELVVLARLAADELEAAVAAVRAQSAGDPEPEEPVLPDPLPPIGPAPEPEIRT